MYSIDIQAPPSKSLSHRMVIGASLAAGISTVRNVLESDDIAWTMGVLRACGVQIKREAAGTFTFQGIAGAPHGGQEQPLDCPVGESGTSCRLLTAILAAGTGLFRVHGGIRMRQRPIGDLTEALEKLGVSVTFEGAPLCPPLVLRTTGLHADALPDAVVGVSCDASSQYLSGLLMAAPLSATGFTVAMEGSKAVSWPYVGLTLQALEAFGLDFSVQTLTPDGVWQQTHWRSLDVAEPHKIRFVMPAGQYTAGDYTVEGDWSSASYFLAAGAIGPNAVTVHGLNNNSLQGDKALLDILTAMGAGVAWHGTAVTVSPGALRGVSVDMGQCPDLVPTVAAVAAHAQGATIITNVAHLRIKESDRLEAPAQELRKVGCVLMVQDDGLVLAPPVQGIRPLAQGECFEVYDDHRMAMSLSLLGLAGQSKRKNALVSLSDPSCVNKSFPNFWEVWDKVIHVQDS